MFQSRGIRSDDTDREKHLRFITQLWESFNPVESGLMILTYSHICESFWSSCFNPLESGLMILTMLLSHVREVGVQFQSRGIRSDDTDIGLMIVS